MSPAFNFKKQERVRRSREFKQIYSRARRLSGPHLTVFLEPNQLTYNRLGLSVSKRRFKLSVQRHCLLRRLREVYRLNKMRFLPGYDIVISVHRRRGFAGPSSVAKDGSTLAREDARRFGQKNLRLKEIKEELLALAQRAGLLRSQ